MEARELQEQLYSLAHYLAHGHDWTSSGARRSNDGRVIIAIEVDALTFWDLHAREQQHREELRMRREEVLRASRERALGRRSQLAARSRTLTTGDSHATTRTTRRRTRRSERQASAARAYQAAAEPPCPGSRGAVSLRRGGRRRRGPTLGWRRRAAQSAVHRRSRRATQDRSGAARGAAAQWPVGVDAEAGVEATNQTQLADLAIDQVRLAERAPLHRQLVSG